MRTKFRNASLFLTVILIVFLGFGGNSAASAQSLETAPSFFIGAHGIGFNDEGIRAIIVSTEDQVLTGEIYSEEVATAATTTYMNVFEDELVGSVPVEITPVQDRKGVFSFSVELERAQAFVIYSESAIGLKLGESSSLLDAMFGDETSANALLFAREENTLAISIVNEDRLNAIEISATIWAQASEATETVSFGPGSMFAEEVEAREETIVKAVVERLNKTADTEIDSDPLAMFETDEWLTYTSVWNVRARHGLSISGEFVKDQPMNLALVWGEGFNPSTTTLSGGESLTVVQNTNGELTCRNAYVNTNTLNVRSGPGVGYSIEKQIYFRNAVAVLEQSNGWVRVSNSNWVSARFLSCNVPTSVSNGGSNGGGGQQNNGTGGSNGGTGGGNNGGGNNGGGALCQLWTSWYHGSGTNPAPGGGDDQIVEAWLPIGQSPNWNAGPNGAPYDYESPTVYPAAPCNSRQVGTGVPMCQLHTSWYHGSKNNPAGGAGDDHDVEAWIAAGQPTGWLAGSGSDFDYNPMTSYAPAACSTYIPTKPRN
jgi:uncharacterized protein YgiM (DUF1202 family)